MGSIWLQYGLLIPYQNHVPLSSFRFDSIVFNYGIATYWHSSIDFPQYLVWERYGSAPYHMIPDSFVWECYVFGTVPYNSHIIHAYQHLIWKCYICFVKSHTIPISFIDTAASDMGMLRISKSSIQFPYHLVMIEFMLF